MGKKTKKNKKRFHQQLEQAIRNEEQTTGVAQALNIEPKKQNATQEETDAKEQAVYSHSKTALADLKKFVFIGSLLIIILVVLTIIENKTHFLLNLSDKLFERFTLFQS
jgi:hypothetical protein